jgi:hypothetical protein
MKRRPIILAATIALAALAMSASPAVASHAWGNYHWARSTSAPLTLEMGDNMTTAQWKTILGQANADWNVSKVLDNHLGPARGGKRCKAVLGTVQVCNGKYGRNGWLGLAQIWLSGGHIVQGVSKMNDTYFSMAAYNNYSEKRHVLCQEVGHTFGLGHTSEDGSSQNTCMDYYRNKTDDRVSIAPNAHDYAQLELIYDHTDGGSSASGKDGSGKAVGNGRNIFVRRLANGRTLVTFIFWAGANGAGRPHHA